MREAGIAGMSIRRSSIFEFEKTCSIRGLLLSLFRLGLRISYI